MLLEALPIPFPSIDALVPSEADISPSYFYCQPHGHAPDARVKVHYAAPFKSRCSPPLVVMPYGVVDTNNISAIIRSAYFFSISALALPTSSTSQPSGFSQRASAGAVEAVALLGVPEPEKFLKESKRLGFRVLATQLPTSRDSASDHQSTMFELKEHFCIPKDYKKLSSAVSSHPTILILGGEAAGVPDSISSLADATVEIERMRGSDEADVDSLNVSVAAGIIFAAARSHERE
jgi:21S rRNA (GM2251-2'-O)-methyltransferase